MKKLDKYIGKNFIVSYAIAFLVLIGLRIIIDLFINLDEFAERVDLGLAGAIKNVLSFYSAQILLYYRDFAGMITVTAAAFSLGKLIKNNELIAVMASGISLKRVLAPIVFIAVAINGLYIIDQEILIPKYSEQLVRKQDSPDGKGHFGVWFMEDSKGSLFCCPNYDIKTKTMTNPVIFIRKKVNDLYYRCTAQIRADFAVYDSDGRWRLENAIMMTKPENPLKEIGQEKPVEFYQSDITASDVPIRRKENFMSLLSSKGLSSLIAQGPRIKDLAELYAQKHERITTPIMNIIMLLVSLPILICREPSAMKNAVMVSFAVTTLCFIVTFGCKMVSSELHFLRPELWMWIPVIVFMPVALLELDSMKT